MESIWKQAAGKQIKFKIGNKEKLKELSKILCPVEFYLDSEGILYVVPKEENEMKIIDSGDNPFIIDF